MSTQNDENLPSPDIGEFAKVLVKEVRDAAIPQCDINLRANAKGVKALGWKKLDPKAGLESVASTMIPDVVDSTVFQLLRALDGKQFKLSFTASNGKWIDLWKDPRDESGGWYMGIPGWRSAYSEERYINYLADLPGAEYRGMAHPELEEFAELLVKMVRDRAIRECDRNLHAKAKSAVALRWKRLTPKAGLKSLAHTLIPDVVDETIFQLLRAIDEGELRLSFTRFFGKRVDLLEDGLGKLAGWYAEIPGWRTAYSKER